MSGSTAQRITAHFGGDWHGNYGTFPAPGHSKHDRGMSIEDAPGAPDGVLVNSFNGGDPLAVKDECRRVGLIDERELPGTSAAEHVAGTYVYQAANGTNLYRTIRKERPGKSKRFVAERLDCGKWVAGMGDIERVPYRLPELLASDDSEPIYFAEGERKADKLAAMGFIATAVPFGCKGWRANYAKYFARRSVVILPDNDDEGRAFALKVKANVDGVGGRAQIVELPGLPPKGDIIDWTGTSDDLRALVSTPPPASSTPPTGSTPGHNGRASVRLQAGDLHGIATQAETALILAEAPLFVRGGIVRPVVDEMPAAHGRTTKVARLAIVDANMMVDHLSRSADWLKFNARKEGWVATDPPLNVATTILSRDGEWRLRKLAGVLTTPTLRPDGTLLCDPGYDPETRLLLMDPPKLPAMSVQPSKEDAEAALALLDQLLDGFPFVNDASRSVALSALITPVVRGAMPVAPLHANTAPVAGTGKSFIVDLASAVVTGDRAPVIAAGRNEEETEKRLGSALLAGLPIISIDNVNGALGGDALCQMIERPVISLRPLGVSKLVRIESRATMFATGNNIQLVGDMTRRVVLCSLDPDMERPELRVFAFNPLHAILKDRGRYIAAALTVARAYFVAGRPGLLPPLASFEAWSDCVRSALVWLGRADPVETMITARADDPVLATLSALLHAWHTTIGERNVTSGSIKEIGEERNPLGNPTHGELQRALVDAASDRSGLVNSKALGRYLGRHRGRIVDGLKLVGTVDSHSKQNVWTVRSA